MVLVKAFPTELCLNFLQVEPSDTQITVYESLYDSDTEYQNLQSKFPDCFFHRDGNKIFCLPLTKEAKTHGTQQTINIVDNSSLFQRLIRESLTHVFKNSMKIVKLLPLKFVDTSRDLISSTKNKNRLQGFHIFPLFEIESKTVILNDSKKIGVVVGASLQYDISWTIKDLIRMGIDVTGIFVIEKLVDTRRNVNVHYHKGLGEISSIKGNNAILVNFSDKSEVDISKCYPEANKKNLRIILSHILSTEYTSCMDEIEKISFNVMGGEEKFNEIEGIRRKLAETPISCSNNLSFSITSEYITENESSDLKTRTLSTPTYVFDPGREKTNQKHDEGINEFGPFDSASFNKKEPRILVVVPAEHKGEVETFMRSFMDGIPTSKRFVKGFVRKYNLQKISKMDFEIVNDLTAEGYKECCLEAFRKINQENSDYDLVFVIIKESFHSLYGNQNPYLVAKSLIMSYGVPVQEIEIETIKQNRSWEFTMNNMGLACYAKLGGIPYTIATARPISHELIIGLGTTTIKKNRFDNNPRYVGITTVFSAEGNYLLYTISREAEFEKYFAELKKSLADVINQISKRLAWQPEDTVRLIFHQQFKPFRDGEVEAIKELVSELTDYNVEYAFVTVHTQHNFSLFDKRKQGFVAKFEQNFKYYGLTRGKFVPDRGYMIKLSPHEALVSVIGPYQLKTPLSGSPKPLLVSLHRLSNFRDIEYLASQVFQFTFLSWRSFFPSTTPVTISYSNIIAHLLGLLHEVENWNPYMLATKLRLSRWFL